MKPAPQVPLEKVEWRVDGKPVVNDRGESARFVPYMDGRDVAALLDEWVGVENWQDSYEPGQIDGKFALWCHLSLWDDERQRWVTKSDVGVPSNFEAQKGACSDAFKRAATVKWGVGRNVYDLPTLWAPCRVDQKGNAWPNDKTLPAILKQLKAQGFDASGGRVAEGGEAKDNTATSRESGASQSHETALVAGDGGGDSQSPAARSGPPVCALCSGPLAGAPVERTADGFAHKGGCPERAAA